MHPPPRGQGPTCRLALLTTVFLLGGFTFYPLPVAGSESSTPLCAPFHQAVASWSRECGDGTTWTMHLLLFIERFHDLPGTTPEGRRCAQEALAAVRADSVIESRITELRLAADYAASSILARELRDRIADEPWRTDYERAVARSRVDLVEWAASLSPEDQAEFARGDSLEGVLIEWWEDVPPERGSALVRRRLDILTRLAGRDRFEVVKWMAQYCGHLYREGDYARALATGREMLELSRRVLGQDHPYVAASLVIIGITLLHQGDGAAAEKCYRAALAIFERSGGSGVVGARATAHNLATLRYEQGDPLGAEPLARAAVASFESRRGVLASTTATSGMHVWLARILLAAGDLESADSLVNSTTRSLREESEQFGARRDWVTNLEVLAEVREANGNLAGSIQARREAVEASRKIQGERHPHVASCLFDLGRSLAAAEQFQESRETLENATTLFRELLGDNHPQVGACLCALGEMDLKEGKLALATRHLEESARVFDGSRTRMAEGMRRAMGKLPSPYEALAVARLETGDDHGAWVATERSLARCLADLLESAGKLSPTSAAEPFGLARIQAAMTDHDALVGWLETPVTARSRASTGHPTRWGYVIRSRGGVTWTPLGREREGESSALRALIVDASRFPLRVPLTTEVEQASLALWHSHFAPLEPSLDGVRNLIVIPSGGMLGLPIEALVDGDGHYLGDRFVISYTPSGTVLTMQAERRAIHIAAGPWKDAPRSGGALLIGDPLLASPRGSEKPYGDEPAAVKLVSHLSREILYRTAAAGNTDALDALPRLPGSRDEVLGISSLLPGSLALLGRDASEPKLVAMAESGELRRYRIVHFATHALVNDRQPERSALVLSRAELPDPVLCAERGTRFHDGLLTADEICREWTLDADLVTLSGCQTGLGRATPGEGYLGLAHSFFQAGARSLLVSLWKVDDETTARLMQRFYANLSGDRGGRMSKAVALREARIWLRDLRESDGTRSFAHPAYWAGFILLGDAAD